VNVNAPVVTSAVAIATVVELWLRLTVAPPPAEAGVMEPETVKVGAEAVKLIPLTFAPFTVTACELGLKLNPDFVGVTVYEPLSTLLKT
jgi:hypothetical protein